MTLIAAFRCYEGVVICADSQETLSKPTPYGWGNYRCKVNKLQPRDTPNYEVVIGGAGHGPLVDGFVNRFMRAARGLEEDLTETDIEDRIRALLLNYHDNEVRVCRSREVDIAFIVCLRNKKTGEIFLRSLMGPSVLTVDDHVLVGWDEQIYRHEVEKLYRPNWVRNRSINLGIHLFLLAKETSNDIGGDTHVVCVTDTGTRPVERESITELENRLRSFNALLSDLAIKSADPSIHHGEFQAHLNVLTEQVTNMRDFYLRGRLDAGWERFKRGEGSIRGVGYVEVPPETVLTARFTVKGKLTKNGQKVQFEVPADALQITRTDEAQPETDTEFDVTIVPAEG